MAKARIISDDQLRDALRIVANFLRGECAAFPDAQLQVDRVRALGVIEHYRAPYFAWGERGEQDDTRAAAARAVAAQAARAVGGPLADALVKCTVREGCTATEHMSECPEAIFRVER